MLIYQYLIKYEHGEKMALEKFYRSDSSFKCDQPNIELINGGVNFAGASEQGVRERNEDRWSVTYGNKYIIYSIADGFQGGEKVSEWVLENLTIRIIEKIEGDGVVSGMLDDTQTPLGLSDTQPLPNMENDDEISENWIEAYEDYGSNPGEVLRIAKVIREAVKVTQINLNDVQIPSSKPERNVDGKKYGTTYVGLVFDKNAGGVFVVCAGDSRAFAVKNDGVAQITSDQVETKESHVLTNCFAKPYRYEADCVITYISKEALAKIKYMVLATDGLVEPERIIGEVLSKETDIKTSASIILDESQKIDNSDNTTVMLIKA